MISKIYVAKPVITKSEQFVAAKQLAENINKSVENEQNWRSDSGTHANSDKICVARAS